MREIFFGNQRFFARADRTLFHPNSGTLFLSDLHLGKGHLFRREGIPIPKESEERDLERLLNAVKETTAKSIWILGDLFHHPKSITSDLMSKWIQTFEVLNISQQVILGNHDKFAEKFASGLGFSIQSEPTKWRDLELAHHPGANSTKPRIAGHIHPNAEFKTATDHIICPCFAIPNDHLLLLPAFTEFSGGARFSVHSTHVFPIVDGYVLDSKQLTQVNSL